MLFNTRCVILRKWSKLFLKYIVGELLLLIDQYSESLTFPRAVSAAGLPLNLCLLNTLSFT